MPERRTFADGQVIRAAPAISFELSTRDPAAYQRRNRAGAASVGKNPIGGALPVEIRNGLPFKPYIYRGVGYDQFTGDGDDD